jgi:hypothetical protein
VDGERLCSTATTADIDRSDIDASHAADGRVIVFTGL